MGENIDGISGGSCSFVSRPDARWIPERSAVEFGIGVGEYEGVGARFPARISNPAFRSPYARTVPRSLPPSPDPVQLIAERKVRRRQLTDDGNVEITGRDLRERYVEASHPRPIG